MKLPLLNKSHTQHSTAEVVDGHLVLSLLNAQDPKIWRMDLDKIGTASFEIKKDSEGNNAKLILKPKKGTAEIIASYGSQEQAMSALSAASQALHHTAKKSKIQKSQKITKQENPPSTDIKEGDIVVVQWTFFTRDVFFDKPLPRRAGEFDNEYMEYLTKLSSNQDLAIKNLMSIYTCLKYLESKKANIIMWFVEGFEQKDFQGGYESFYNKLFSEIDKYNFTGELWNPIFTTDDIRDTSKSNKQPYYLDFGLDNLHPGVKTHKKMSYLLEKIINTKFLQ